MVRMTPAERNIALGQLQAGVAVDQVATSFGVHRTTIQRLARRFQATGTANDRPRSGRPRCTTAAQDRLIIRQHVRDPFRSAVETARNLPRANPVSAQTVINRLRSRGLRCRRPNVGLVLNAQSRAARLQWARAHQQWPRQRWLNILFSDESRFLLRRADGRQRVYRRVNQRHQQNHVVEVDRFGGGGVMVWGGITATGRTALYRVNGNLTGQRYRDEILRQHVVPFIRNNGGVFQHDNAPPHTARVATDFLRHQGIATLPWPARSPDLNPIEHVWDTLGRRVRQRPRQPRNENELFQALDAEWQDLPQAQLNNLVSSMGRRCLAVMHAGGGHTRY